MYSIIILSWRYILIQSVPGKYLVSIHQEGAVVLLEAAINPQKKKSMHEYHTM